MWKGDKAFSTWNWSAKLTQRVVELHTAVQIGAIFLEVIQQSKMISN